jgi:hypothetical protein
VRHQERFSGLRTVRGRRRRAFRPVCWRPTDDEVELQRRTKFLSNLPNHLAPLSVLMLGGYPVTTGAATVGIVVAFISGLQRLADPSRELLA